MCSVYLYPGAKRKKWPKAWGACAMQQRRRHRPIIITMHNATTARDLQLPRPGRQRHRTSHRHLATRNAETLRKLNGPQDRAPARGSLSG